ncbi:MAG: hypothetical protein MUC33_01155 [Desulfobacterales bacterium]|jgi:hypothetical protein|nr:hypothetical protein [Desulfobacterales bacterium]MCU0601250.1 hypothetical protein [Desulfobacterales bacterium]
MASLVEFCGEVRRETEKAYLVFDGQHETWIPKSVVKSERRVKASHRNDFIFEIPEWLAKEKGIV